MRKNIEQLSLLPVENPFTVGTKYANRMFPKIKSAEPKKQNSRRRIANDGTYRSFYEEAQKLSGDIRTETERKRGLLAEYFPAQFGEKGRQPLNEMKNHYMIGALFKKMLDYSEKRR